MQKNNFTTISTILITLVLLSRLIPHQPNFTPLIAVAIFSSMIFNNKKYFFIPLLGLFFSDLLLEQTIGYKYIFSPIFYWTYISVFSVFLFSYFFNNEIKIKNIVINSISGALIFFFVSNFGVWISSGGFYPLNFSGLISCYAAAIPFFRNTLSSTLLYSVILFAPVLLKNKALFSESIFSKNS